MATRKVNKAKWYVLLATWVVTHVRVMVTWLVASGMAAACGWASYVNTRTTATLGHSDKGTAALLGAVPDLLMGLCLLGIGAKRRANERASYWVWAGFVSGLVLSVVCNEIAKWGFGWVGRGEGLFLPIVVMLSVEAVRNANKSIRKTVKPVRQNGTAKAPEKAVERRTGQVGSPVWAAR